MTALLYRTFAINVGSTMPSFVVVLLFCFPLPFPWLDYLSIYTILLATLPTVFLLQRDRKDRWYELAPTLPISPQAVVGEKYLLTGGYVCLLPLLIANGQQFFSAHLAPPPMGRTLLAIALLLVFSACFLFLVFWLGPRRLVLPYLLLLVLFLALDMGCGVLTGHPLTFQPVPPLPFLAGAVLLFLLSYRAAVGRYIHRTW
ncbi:MAG: ABC-2 transporter permease [Clostridiales bacterium]|nr:ABC-2 transporter permease [Clostridiales bacterium]